MPDVNIGYEGLERASAQLKAGESDMKDQLKSLKAMIDGLVNGEFRTQLASGRFQESYTQWDSGMQNALNGLEGMSTFLRDVETAHQDLDRNLARGASS